MSKSGLAPQCPFAPLEMARGAIPAEGAIRATVAPVAVICLGVGDAGKIEGADSLDATSWSFSPGVALVSPVGDWHASMARGGAFMLLTANPLLIG